jgi:antitoxin HicB
MTPRAVSYFSLMGPKYRTVIRWLADEERYEASVPALGAHGFGRSEAAALAELHKVVSRRLKLCEELGEPAPDPVPEVYSGNLRLRLPRGLHKRLAELAEEEGMSLNMLIVSMLGEAVGERPHVRRELLTQAVADAKLVGKLGDAVAAWDGKDLRCYPLPHVGGGSTMKAAHEQMMALVREKPWGVDIGSCETMLTQTEGKRLETSLRRVGIYYVDRPGRGRPGSRSDV